ncbi:ATP-binding protein [Streptomyces sp. NPDC001407]|uniref:ATP-binding protein n=1 Tax=Streptomyces sp. NPDC001407 TaxID=3364573 RepID=UPI00369A3121
MHALPRQKSQQQAETADDDAVVIERSLHFSIPAVPAAVPAARCEVTGQLGLWGLGSATVLETAVLAVSELVTNTVRHTAVARADIRLGLDERHLTVAVHDRDPRLPRRAAVAHLDGSGGWGLRLVQALAVEAGGRTSTPLDADGGGKTVTVLLPL